VSVSSVSLSQPTAATAGSVTVALGLARGVRYPASDHRIGVLLVDQTGKPLGIDYTAQATTTTGRGDIRSVKLTIPAGTVMPSHLQAYVMADVFALASKQLY
jgi:hypothetical protein